MFSESATFFTIAADFWKSGISLSLSGSFMICSIPFRLRMSGTLRQMSLTPW